MVDMMNAMLSNDEPTVSKSLALIKLISKITKPSKITEYRPISLLCTDYKLLAAILAKRLSKTLLTTISAQQRGSVPGRKIEQNLTLVRDRIQYLQERNMDGAIITVDFAKAYDLVNRKIVWKIMGLKCTPTSTIWNRKHGKNKGYNFNQTRLSAIRPTSYPLPGTTAPPTRRKTVRFENHATFHKNMCIHRRC